MAAKTPRKKAAAASSTPRKPRRKKAEPASRGLTPDQVARGSEAPELTALLEGIGADGGQVLGHYREPLGGHAIALAALPIDKVEPTPYQRDVSEPHVKRLAFRLGFTRHTDPDKVEAELQALLPSSRWMKGHQLLVWHGRRTCLARAPACERCVVAPLCPKKGVKLTPTGAGPRGSARGSP